ncbi:MAG: prephenate dehydrogenase/arogenate dehydrogenase family protein [Clostridia bacterium]|nr:prephenate dehydrogenase/arogenate dehydrogenase family protein [Clostridia bacterium]
MGKELSKIAIIGLGLIGGSITKALKAAGFKGEVVGIDSNLTSVAYGLQNGLITSGGTTINNLVIGSDLVIVATHLRFFEEVVQDLLALDSSLLITDVGSVKKCEFIHELVATKKLNFIGGHPLAGSEKTGIENGSAKLFEDKPYYIIPYKNKVSDTAKVLSFVELIGAKPIIMEEEKHDALMSMTSHVPHLLAALQMNILFEHQSEEIIEHIGEGFKDATRIASSCPDLWSDIVLFNREKILSQVEQLQSEMSKLTDLLQQNDRNQVYNYFKQASNFRNQLS